MSINIGKPQKHMNKNQYGALISSKGSDGMNHKIINSGGHITITNEPILYDPISRKTSFLRQMVLSTSFGDWPVGMAGGAR
ncbi:carboxylate-amine ligase AZOLI_0487 [Pseudomonas sp. St29]|nr:carboxylate-amine ligase AZOLI_0487 [Pseudomonas sp. St29]